MSFEEIKEPEAATEDRIFNRNIELLKMLTFMEIDFINQYRYLDSPNEELRIRAIKECLRMLDSIILQFGAFFKVEDVERVEKDLEYLKKNVKGMGNQPIKQNRFKQYEEISTGIRSSFKDIRTLFQNRGFDSQKGIDGNSLWING